MNQKNIVNLCNIVGNTHNIVSADGKRTGISVRGLARLATGRESGDMFNETRNRILFLMASGVDHNDILKSLKSAWGNVFVVDHKGSDGAKIVTEKAAVAIIKYFAIVDFHILEAAMNSLKESKTA